MEYASSGREGDAGPGGSHIALEVEDAPGLSEISGPHLFLFSRPLGSRSGRKKKKRNLLRAFVLLPGILGLLTEVRLLGLSAAPSGATEEGGAHRPQDHRVPPSSSLPAFLLSTIMKLILPVWDDHISMPKIVR